MKKIIISNLFLNLYLLALVGPALPIIDYFINYDLIVSELCENKDKPILTCNGKCYLKKEVVKNEKLQHNENKTSQLPKLDLSAYPLFVLLETPFRSSDLFYELKEKLYFKYKETFQEIVFSIFQPPQ